METIIYETADVTAGRFRKHFQEAFVSHEHPIVVRSPGRVNLIGEHTDYNEGFVLPAAVDKAIYLALSPRSGERFRIHSLDMNERYEDSTGAPQRSLDLQWPNYLAGVVDQFRKHGYAVGGFDCLFGGDVPIGAGMSSSAAIECGLAYGLNELFEIGIPRLELVRMAQKAEHEFVGVQCGIMDQFINIFGESRKVLKLDCRSLDYEQIPFERPTLTIVLCETPTRRDLASSGYNERRRQCEEGVRLLRQDHPSIGSLRDVTEEMLAASRSRLSDLVYRRCAYVVKENRRVLEACRALEAADFASFGRLMYESHDGLSGEYEVSSPGLDALVEGARAFDGVLGARMMGGGFGGCTINLVDEEATDAFSEYIRSYYRARMQEGLVVHRAKLTSGTHRIDNH
ncbi:MAG: galactokinase [Acidobacteriota bacterium]